MPQVKACRVANCPRHAPMTGEQAGWCDTHWPARRIAANAERNARRHATPRRAEQAAVYADARWAKVRKVVLARDVVCQRCGTDQDLEVHHVWGWEDEEMRYDPEGLLTLCEACHPKVDRARRDGS